MFLQCPVYTYNFKNSTSSLIQLLLMYTEFEYLYNFYLLLISFATSKFLYIINVHQYH